MAKASDGGVRRRAIAVAIAAELDRQAQTNSTGVDIEALARAIDEVLDPPLPMAEGKHPDELNSTNDD